ncbi:hypothetical protein TRIUR3_29546 [Triticum urartu]|uniref:Uncharacterized protein n=1 Tax=Triticum urartu TaxID=4572 RepID=M8AB75_TRIUA|nr:hypothetical protein TRIUR3_29546 [Triticum urartu]
MASGRGSTRGVGEENGRTGWRGPGGARRSSGGEEEDLGWLKAPASAGRCREQKQLQELDGATEP